MLTIILLGLITTILMGIFKKIPTVAEFSAWTKQMIVLVIAFVATLIKNKVGVDVPVAVQMIVVEGILAALTAFGLYNLYASHFKPTPEPVTAKAL